MQGFRCGSLFGAVACPLVQGCRAFGACPLLLCRVPCLLPAFLLCLWCITLKYGSIWLFKGVFSGFCGADVCLYGLRSLRRLWGFYVREVFGGFGACGVFPAKSFFCPFLLFSSLVLFRPLLCSFRPALVLLSWLALLLGFWCWFFFPSDGFRYKKKGREGLPLASSLVLLWCVVIRLLRMVLGNYCKPFRPSGHFQLSTQP